MKHLQSTYLAALTILGVSFSVNADMLTFDAADACSSACVNFDLIDQSYGDGVGVDFVWSDVSIGGGPGMQFWDDWGGTTDAIFAGEDDTYSIGQIDIIALSGFAVTLGGFDLTAYLFDRTSSWMIEDLAGGTLASSGGDVAILFSDVTSVSAGFTSSAGFRITWGPIAYNVGLDNLSYDVTSVPEPGTLFLFGLGLAGLGMLRRKTNL
jgi:hypothetical protein